MNQNSLDVVETLWGSGFSGAFGGDLTDLPVLMRSAPVGVMLEAVSSGALGIQGIAKSSPFAPDGDGGEVVFCYAHLTFAWRAVAIISVVAQVDLRPLNNLSTNPAPVGEPLGYQTATKHIYLPQQSLAADNKRRVQTFSVPLHRQAMDEVHPTVNVDQFFETSRQFARGTSLELQLAIIGVPGCGELHLDGAEIEFERLPRKTTRAALAPSGSAPPGKVIP